MNITTASMPCSDLTRPRMPEGASSECGYGRDNAPFNSAAWGTALSSSGLFGRQGIATAGRVATFAPKDSTGIRGWSPPV